MRRPLVSRLCARRAWPALAGALAAGAGCRDAAVGVVRFPLEVALAPRDSLRVGDSAAVAVTVYEGGDRVVTGAPASARLSVSDTAVARLRGAWLVGRRPGRVTLRAESGGQAGEAQTAVVR